MTRYGFCRIVIGAVMLCSSQFPRAFAEEPHQSHEEAEDAHTDEENEPLVFELQLEKTEEPAFTLKPGRYRISHHLEASGPFSAQVTLLEEVGGTKRIPLLDTASREVKVTDFSGEATYLLFGDYELQYRLRGKDLAGEIRFERIEEPPAETGPFAGVYLGLIERDDQVSTLRRTKPTPSEQRVSLVIRQEESGIRVEQDGSTLSQVATKGQVLIGSITQSSNPAEGQGACQEERTIILQKKQKSSGRLRVFARHSCPDGTLLWTSFSGTVLRR